MPETRDEAHRLWKQVGLQYQNENENELKDQLDYLTEPPKYYPSNCECFLMGFFYIAKENMNIFF